MSRQTPADTWCGFSSCTGIYPLNRHKIPDHRYAPSMTTDNSVPTSSAVDQTTAAAATTVMMNVNASDLSTPEGLTFDAPAPGTELMIVVHHETVETSG